MSERSVRVGWNVNDFEHRVSDVTQRARREHKEESEIWFTKLNVDDYQVAGQL
jgi:hypothetical protein